MFVKELDKLINSLSVNKEKTNIYKELTEATKKSRESGDTSELEEILKKIKT